MPALGGPEVKLAEAYANGQRRSLDWSPDGSLLAVTDKSVRQSPFSSGSPHDPFSIFLVARETGEKRKLTSPPEQSIGDGGVAFSPDGKLLAFIRTGAMYSEDIYLVPITGGEPRRITFDNRWLGGLAWTADGTAIIFSSNRGGSFSLWKVTADGGSPEPLAAVGQNPANPTTSRQGNRLAYEQSFEDSNIWRVSLPNRDRTKLPKKVVASTRAEYSPQYSPDGKKIVFQSDRSGSMEIWTCDSEGEHLSQLTSFGGPEVGAPHWSPDGLYIAFGSNAAGGNNIYVISAAGGIPHRLTSGTSTDIRPSWSIDGKWIYFGSNRSGDWQLWKVQAEGGQVIQVTRQGGREALPSTDGQFVYYDKGSGNERSLWKVPVDGDEEVPVLDHIRQGHWALQQTGIYFVSPLEKLTVQFYSFATRQATSVATLEKELLQGPPAITVSPGGRWLLYVQVDQNNGDIMMVDNFRVR